MSAICSPEHVVSCAVSGVVSWASGKVPNSATRTKTIYKSKGSVGVCGKDKRVLVLLRKCPYLSLLNS